MHTAFLDESYSDTFYFVGAAVGSDAAWHDVSAGLADLRILLAREYGLAPDIEFHAAALLGGRGEWKQLRGRHREAAGIVTDVLEIARSARIEYMIRGVHMPGLTARYTMPDHPHSVALEHVLQRVEKHAGRFDSRRSVRLVADMIDIREELQSQFAGYQNRGRRRGTAWENLATPMIFGDSRETAGLQVADLAVYLYRRDHAVTDQHPAAARALRRHLRIMEDSMLDDHGIWYPIPELR